jgi:S1-C subfamily serine protease
MSVHILVVDDEVGFRTLLLRLLEPAGYEVRTATNAHEALRRIEEDPPAVLISDIHMPGPDGLWLASQVRARSPHTAMVLATSDATVPPTESMRRGIIAYILKPLQREAVLKSVAAAFRWWAEQSGGELPALVPRAPIEPEAAPAPAARSARRANSGELVISRRTALAVVVAALLIAAAVFLYWRLGKPARVLAAVAEASGAVMVYDGDGQPLQQGSGFFVGPDLFVTNHHVVNGGLRSTIVRPRGVRYAVAGVTAIDRRADLVVLKTTRQSDAYLPLATTTPQIGDAIAVYGAPLGVTGTLSTGIISAAPEADGAPLQISAPISHGSSGSPVVNADGDVVGVATSFNALGQALNYAIPAPRLSALLRQAGDVQPLIAASRGAGDDRERNDLIGPVRSAIISADQDETPTRLIFDREGKLAERTIGDAYGTADALVAGCIPAAARDEHDEFGNVIVRHCADGTILNLSYRLDRRGNWLEREISRVTTGASEILARETRVIDYWE